MTLTISLLVFTAISTATSLVLSLFFGALTAAAAWISFAIGLAAAWHTHTQCKNISSGQPRPTKIEIALMTFFVLFCLRNFLWTYFYRGGQIFTLNQIGRASCRERVSDPV